MNLPNKLTTLRVIMVPVFVLFYLLSHGEGWMKYAAAVIFVLAAVTDLFDGMIARKRHLVTDFGKFMDPLADKLLVCSALICLVHYSLIPTWVVITIIAREFTISGFRQIAAEHGLVLAASKLAKVKTDIQMVMTVALILNFTPVFFRVLGQILIYASLILTVVSLAEYLIKNRSILSGQM